MSIISKLLNHTCTYKLSGTEFTVRIIHRILAAFQCSDNLALQTQTPKRSIDALWFVMGGIMQMYHLPTTLGDCYKCEIVVMRLTHLCFWQCIFPAIWAETFPTSNASLIPAESPQVCKESRGLWYHSRPTSEQKVI